jgi:hypothetical protein
MSSNPKCNRDEFPLSKFIEEADLLPVRFISVPPPPKKKYFETKVLLIIRRDSMLYVIFQC